MLPYAEPRSPSSAFGDEDAYPWDARKGSWRIDSPPAPLASAAEALCFVFDLPKASLATAQARLMHSAAALSGRLQVQPSDDRPITAR